MPYSYKVCARRVNKKRLVSENQLNCCVGSRVDNDDDDDDDDDDNDDDDNNNNYNKMPS